MPHIQVTVLEVCPCAHQTKNIPAGIDTKQEISYYSFQLIKGFPSWQYRDKSSYKRIAGGIEIQGENSYTD